MKAFDSFDSVSDLKFPIDLIRWLLLSDLMHLDIRFPGNETFGLGQLCNSRPYLNLMQIDRVTVLHQNIR